MMSTMLTNMFHLGLPIAEKIVRVIVVYGFLIFGLRLAGKRELAQLNTFDLVVLLMLSNTVQNAIIGEDNSITGGLIGAATLLLLNHLVVRVLYSHEKLDRVIEGDPAVLIENGSINADRLRDELITEAQVELAAQKQGFASLDEIDRAVLEPGGSLCFTPKRPVPSDTRHEEIMSELRRISEQLAVRS
jgi:uncharacterized membrane protein YcaP (DUF421 family)